MINFFKHSIRISSLISLFLAMFLLDNSTGLTDTIDSSEILTTTANSPSIATIHQRRRTRRTVGRRPNARTTPRTLPSKAKTFLGGGGGFDVGVCRGDYIIPNNIEIFGVFPEYGHIQLNKPHVVADLIVDTCHNQNTKHLFANVKYDFILYAPDGREVEKQEGPLFWYNFPQNSPTGEYELHILSSSSILTKSFSVAEYDGPRIELSDSITDKTLPRQGEYGIKVNRDHGINVDYYGFGPETRLEVGLYKHTGNIDVGDPAGNAELELIDSWFLQTDAIGRLNEFIRFASLPDKRMFCRG